MKKILKKIYMILAVIIVLVVLAVVLIGAFAGRGVKIAIETAATRALNVGVSVEDVDISILGGEIGFEKLASLIESTVVVCCKAHWIDCLSLKWI